MGEWWDYQRLVIARAWRQEWLRRDVLKWAVGVLSLAALAFAATLAGSGWQFSWPAFLITVGTGLAVVALMFIVTVSREPAKIHREQQNQLKEYGARASEGDNLRSAADDIVATLKSLRIPDEWSDPIKSHAFLAAITREQLRALRLFRQAQLDGILDAALPLSADGSDEHELMAWLRLSQYAETRWPGQLAALSDMGYLQKGNATTQLQHAIETTPAFIPHAIGLVNAVIRNAMAPIPGQTSPLPRP